MKRCLYLLVFFSSVIHAQVRDPRAELQIQTRIWQMPVSPDEKVWLVTAFDGVYFAENINSNWHNWEDFYKQKNVFGIYGAELNAISFFNKDTAIATGSSYDSGMQGVCDWTGDGGKSWQRRTLPGIQPCCCMSMGCVDKRGYAWILAGNIFFSKDFGLTWENVDTSANYERISSIAMVNHRDGIASALRNKIYTTHDNWKSYDTIATPLDQKKYASDKSYELGDVNKVEIWGKYIVIGQSGHVFYAEKDNIDWKAFPVDLIDFEVDNDAQQLFAVTKSLNIILFSDPGKYRLLSNKKLNNNDYFDPFRLQVVNHSLYLIGAAQRLYKVNNDTFIDTQPYTADYRIKKPGITKQAGNLCVGVEGRSIYWSYNNGLDWYRQKTVDFTIADIHILNDSSVTLWDRDKNYLYSFSSDSLKEYTPVHPFGPFLKYPVKSFSMQVNCEGHAAGLGEKVIYTKEAGTDSFTVSVIKKERTWKNTKDEDDTTFRGKVSAEPLLARLNYINDNTAAMPSINDFHISDSDKKKYFKTVDQRINNNSSDYWQKRMVNKEFYDALPGKLDTVSAETIKQTLNWMECISMTACTLIINIINENNDTIKFSNENSCRAASWHLPWECRYGDIVFNCYDVGLSRFIKYCKPAEYGANEVFDNSYLIMEIADYLYNK